MKQEIDILEFFDINNIDHIKAYHKLLKTGLWPEGFIPSNVTFNVTAWMYDLAIEIANAYVETCLKGDGNYFIVGDTFILHKNDFRSLTIDVQPFKKPKIVINNRFECIKKEASLKVLSQLHLYKVINTAQLNNFVEKINLLFCD